ncbi:hypothetical protein BDR03DRAFT_18988 [Suillus americanus]|nr:hypothetical protein BDR03DRAFT_18988 [Suillus americanus]
MYQHMLDCASDHTSASTQPTPPTHSSSPTRQCPTHISYTSRTFYRVFHYTGDYPELLQLLIPTTMISTPFPLVPQPTPTRTPYRCTAPSPYYRVISTEIHVILTLPSRGSKVNCLIHSTILVSIEPTQCKTVSPHSTSPRRRSSFHRCSYPSDA